MESGGAVLQVVVCFSVIVARFKCTFFFNWKLNERSVTRT